MAHADTLYILDCCYASRAAIDGNNELLAASSREIPMTSSLSSSFTYILAEYLESLAGQPVTVAQIHAHLLREAHLNRLSTTPVHATLTAERPCVTLYPQAAAQGHPTAFAEHTAPTREMAEEGSLRALVKVAIQGQVTTPTIQEWKAWLATNMLPYTNDIEIEAAFTSISSMLLISMPLEVWTAMADHPALELVDFVTSRNLLAGE